MWPFLDVCIGDSACKKLQKLMFGLLAHVFSSGNKTMLDAVAITKATSEIEGTPKGLRRSEKGGKFREMGTRVARVSWPCHHTLQSFGRAVPLGPVNFGIHGAELLGGLFDAVRAAV
jgi:hypothetical protein